MNTYIANKSIDSMISFINGQPSRQYILTHPKEYKRAAFPFSISGDVFTKKGTVHQYYTDIHGDLFEVGGRYVWMHKRA